MPSATLTDRVQRLEQELGRLSKTLPAHLELVADGNLSVKEAAKLTGISRPEIYKMMSQGRLPRMKYGKRTLIPKRALLEFLAALLAETS